MYGLIDFYKVDYVIKTDFSKFTQLINDKGTIWI